MLVHQNRQLYLGAAAIGTGDQNGLFHTVDGKTKAAAEAAHIVQAAFVTGTGNMLFHQFHRSVASGDVYAGSGVRCGEGILVIHIEKLLALFP